MIAWAGSDKHRPSFLEFPLLLAERDSYQALNQVLRSGGVVSYNVAEFSRAMLSPNPDGAEAYVCAALSRGQNPHCGDVLQLRAAYSTSISNSKFKQIS